MRYKKLGKSDLVVSEISLGSWLTYGGGVGRERALACVERALHVGINFFDTANVYAQGGAETLLGEALAKRPRDGHILATKLYFPMSPSDSGLSAAQVTKQLEASLRRLRTDYVDLYQCHRYDAETPLEETMRALTDAVSSGKVRYIGFSEWSPEQIRASFAVPGVTRFVSSQPQYSMVWRAPEREVFPLCDELGIGQIVWSPLAQGVLTGKYKPGAPAPADSRAADPRMGYFVQEDVKNRPVLDAVERLRPIAAELRLTMAQLALAWVLRTQSVTSAIVGASRPEQIDDNAGASGVTLSPDAIGRIERALGGAALS